MLSTYEDSLVRMAFMMDCDSSMLKHNEVEDDDDGVVEQLKAIESKLAEY